ncbi:hypothetical protein DBV15_08969 [Temnothorax longispinosus]|uniref:Uncharacterized protein n=1 Tax=Temnothorax longispinosus TaxID=300112 RepID=A0A4S2KTQ8_9HYME|nr:hypothetical protein DBV15_08969 [Temnothorax longispinosus]
MWFWWRSDIVGNKVSHKLSFGGEPRGPAIIMNLLHARQVIPCDYHLENRRREHEEHAPRRSFRPNDGYPGAMTNNTLIWTLECPLAALSWTSTFVPGDIVKTYFMFNAMGYL